MNILTCVQLPTLCLQCTHEDSATQPQDVLQEVRQKTSDKAMTAIMHSLCRFCCRRTPRTRRLSWLLGAITVCSLTLLSLNLFEHSAHSRLFSQVHPYNSIMSPGEGQVTLSSCEADSARRTTTMQGSSWLWPFQAGFQHLLFSGDDAATANTADEPKSSGCRNILSGALQGRWVPKPNVSERSKRDMDEYLIHTRGEFRIPASLQRADGK
jgi:hypothetical protein